MSLNLHVLVLGHKGVVLGQEVARFHAPNVSYTTMYGHDGSYTCIHTVSYYGTSVSCFV